MHGNVKHSVRLKLPCLIVAVTHLVIIVLSLYERIWELIKLEEPFHIEEHMVILTSYVVQVSTVCLLIIGSVTGNTYYLIPWLLCTTPLFLSATLYALLYVTNEETSQIFLNFIVVGIVWSTWYIVIKFHLENKRSRLIY